MVQAVIVIALLWTATTLPFKMKGWLGGAVMGFTANKVGGLAKNGLKFGKNAGMAKLDKVAANNGKSTPWAMIKGYRDKGKKEWDTAQGLNVAAGRDLHTKLWKDQPGQERLREYERLEKAAEAELGEYDEEADQAGRCQNGKPKDLSERLKLTAFTKRAMKNRNLNDDMQTIYFAHESGLISRDFELRDKMMHSYNFNDYDDFEKKVGKIDGGVVGQSAVMNICKQLHADENGELDPDAEERATRMGSWYSQWSLANGQSHTTHLTTIDMKTGKVKWNHDGEIIDNNGNVTGHNWTNQAKAAASEEAKVDPQQNMRTKSYQAIIKIKPVFDPATGETSNKAYGEATDELIQNVLTRPESFVSGYLSQTGRMNPEQRDALIHQVNNTALDDTGKTNTLRELLKKEKAAFDDGKLTERKVYDEINSFISTKKAEGKAIDLTKDSTSAMLKDAGMMDLDSANVCQGTANLFTRGL